MDTKELRRRLDFLVTERSTWEAHWQEIVDFILPNRQGFTVKRTEGEKAMSQIYDATAIHALFLFASGLCGLLTNQASQWFEITAEREELNDLDTVRDWLYIVRQRMLAVLNKSNFYNEIDELYKDFGGLGTACLYMAEHPRTVVYFKTVHLAQVFIAENQFEEVDQVYRKFPMTARQIQAEWGDRSSAKVQAAVKDQAETKFDIVHAVFPRKEGNKGKRDNRSLPWSSIYFEYSEEQQLSESGYRELPYFVARWSPAAEEKYGRGLGMIALPDVKGLNRIEYDILRAAAKKVDPPLMLSNDSMINPMRLNPGGVNILGADTVKDKYGFFVPPTDLGYSEQKLEQKRSQIRQIFFNDMLQLLQGPDMTAFEVARRQEEKMRLLGSMYGRLQSELFGPMFDRFFSILISGGYLPPPPPELFGESLKIDYLSPLARAQKMAEADQIMRTITYATSMAQAVPDVLDNSDFDQVYRKLADISGMPRNLIRPLKDVAKLRQHRQQVQQAQELAATLAQAAQTAPQLSKAPEAGSPLGQMMQKPGEAAGNV